MNLFTDSLNTYRTQLIKNIWEKYFKTKIEFEEFKNSILEISKKDVNYYRHEPKENIAIDENRCRACIYRRKERGQCKRNKYLDNDYCQKHMLNNYYGDID